MQLIQRVFWPQIADPVRRRRLFSFLASHRGLCQEISFFTEGDGSDWRWLEPAELARRAAIMAEAVREARAGGFSVAVNILNTLGHSDDGGADAPLPGWRTMVGHDGSTTRIVPCPQEPAFLDYVRLKYRSFAGSGANRYWIDDDVRLRHHHPVDWGCFCTACLASCAARFGCPPDRGAVVAAIHGGPAGRDAWEAHERDVLGAVIDAAVDGIREADPTAEIGFMTCGTRDHGEVMGRIARRAPRAWLRPGGGFWNDAEPRAMLAKHISINAQADGVGQGVGIAYEVENYPYATGAKSAAMTGLESLLAIGAGRLDAIMFDVLDCLGNDPQGGAEWFQRFAAWAPDLQAMGRAVAGTACSGWLPAGGMDRVMQTMGAAQALQLAGLPLAADREGARGWILTGPVSHALGPAELAALFSRPVIMDGESAQRCLDAGLGERIGIRSLTPHRQGVHEVFTDHPHNGRDAGIVRGFTLGYFGLTSHAIEPGPGARVLSRLVATGGRDLGAALSLHAPAGSAPVTVIGHAPWTHALSGPRMRQLAAVASGMLADVLPVRTQASGAGAWWFRCGGGRDLAVLANPGFDPLEVACAHRDAGAPPRLSCAVGGAGATAAPADGMTVRLPPWSAAVVAWERG